VVQEEQVRFLQAQAPHMVAVGVGVQQMLVILLLAALEAAEGEDLQQVKLMVALEAQILEVAAAVVPQMLLEVLEDLE
jgi:hypothetical protein